MGPLKDIPVEQDTSNARYAADLVGDDEPKRLYAARVLLRRVRTAWRLAVRDDADIRTIEARQTLSEFDELVAPRCIRQLTVRSTVKTCAKILGLLETQAALSTLEEQLNTAQKRRTQRALRRAIERVEGAQ